MKSQSHERTLSDLKKYFQYCSNYTFNSKSRIYMVDNNPSCSIEIVLQRLLEFFKIKRLSITYNCYIFLRKYTLIYEKSYLKSIRFNSNNLANILNKNY